MHDGLYCIDPLLPLRLGIYDLLTELMQLQCNAEILSELSEREREGERERREGEKERWSIVGSEA